MSIIRWSCLLALPLAAQCALAQVAINIAWEPVTEEDRQLAAPVVEKGAGAEALFWTVHMRDEPRGEDLERVLYHYIRIKVFDDKGKEKVSTIDIEFGPKIGILNIAARTIKRDGTIVDMKSNAVYQRDLVRAGGRKVQVKSFALPAVEPGAIVEYRYREVRSNTNLLYERLQMQREFPVRKVTYYVMPLSEKYTTYHMRRWTFNCQPSPLKQENNGFTSFSLENVPEFHEEPYMQSEANVRPWVLLYYRPDEKRDPDKYWNEIGRKYYNQLRDAQKASDEIRHAAAEAVAAATTPEEKAAAMVRYIWKHVRGLHDPGVTEAERSQWRAKLPKGRARTAAEVLKSGIGNSDERNLLFVGMATSVGLEARPALLPSRDDILFTPRMADDYFLDNVDTAIKVGDQWKLYDVSAHLPPGMLGWTEEGQPALLSDPKKPVFVDAPVAPPASSLIKRTARMTLSEDGTLEGDVEESFSGHAAPERRDKLAGESEARQQEIYKEIVTGVFPQAEVSAIAFQNVDDPAEPLIVKYRIKAPGYAVRTAKRIVLQPMFFERGAAPMFTAAERRYDVVMRYGWEERDDISIRWPAGFVLDSGENQPPMNFGKTGRYELKIATRGKSELVIARELVFGDNGMLQFSRQDYPKLKHAFDALHGNDAVAITLRQTEAAK